MAIGNVKVNGNSAYVYDEKGHNIACLSLAGRKLAGFSSKFICVQNGSTIYVYDEKMHNTCCLSLSGGSVYSCTGTINIKRGNSIYMYDEKGHQKGITSA